MKKIHPCPFCGSAKVEASGHNHPRAVVSVHCSGCGAEGPGIDVEHTFRQRPVGPNNRRKWDREGQAATDKAIEAWNTRLPEKSDAEDQRSAHA